jgi:serine/threonine-protein kinase
VKPGNVLIRADGVTKLADLGIATASDGTRITRSGMVLGTAAYMAPEQLDGRGAGPPADVYALAAIAFEALSGKKAREGKTPIEIAHSMTTEPAPDVREAWPKAPAAVARVLQRGMALEPEDRPASAGEFARELADALDEEPEPTAPTRRFPRTAPVPAPVPSGEEETGQPRAARRHPSFAAIALALVFLALAIAAIVGAITSGGDDKSPSNADRTPAQQPAKKDNAKEKAPPKKEKKDEEQAAPAPAEEEQAPADSASGAELNAQGFDLMNQGRYEEAIPILQQAVESFPPETTDLNYAYALFNLGKSLRLAGRYDEAVKVLKQRLKIPNQTETVRQELELAKQQAKED